MTFTPKEITAMATEAGFGRNGFSECLVRGSRGVWIDVQDEVNRLVALVAEKAAAKEREACAKVCDELAELNRTAPTDSMWQWGECAAAIRARGTKEGA